MVEGQDPHQLPQQHLLRQRRLRGRGGGQDLLRLESSRLRKSGRPLRRGRRAAGGGDAGGADLLADRLRPGDEPQRREGPAQRRAREDARPGRARGQRRGLPGHDRLTGPEEEPDQPADRGVGGAVLHGLAAPAGRRQVRRRTGVRRRAADQVDARPRPPERRRSDRQRPALGPRPDRCRRRDRQRQRRGAGDGRRPGLRQQPVQPGHQRPAPAGLLVQAVHARHGAQGGPLARRGLRVRSRSRCRSRPR